MTHDGAVRAMVGGREKGAAQFNRATQALRQPGSAFKPIVYAAGLEAGLGPLDVMEDAPIQHRQLVALELHERYRGPVTLREALAHSDQHRRRARLAARRDRPGRRPGRALGLPKPDPRRRRPSRSAPPRCG